jgi:hypothetical protein
MTAESSREMTDNVYKWHVLRATREGERVQVSKLGQHMARNLVTNTGGAARVGVTSNARRILVTKALGKKRSLARTIRTLHHLGRQSVRMGDGEK